MLCHGGSCVIDLSGADLSPSGVLDFFSKGTASRSPRVNFRVASRPLVIAPKGAESPVVWE